jgi:hypothetical protein
LVARFSIRSANFLLSVLKCGFVNLHCKLGDHKYADKHPELKYADEHPERWDKEKYVQLDGVAAVVVVWWQQEWRWLWWWWWWLWW